MSKSATEAPADSVPTYKYLTLERRDAVAVVTISRPEKYNALNRDTLGELDDVFARLDADREVRCVVLTGAGEKAFVSGADIGELSVLDARGAEEISSYGQRVFQRIATFRCPVIAAVNGFALGGGCELAIACHMRFASENAKLGVPEVGLGIIPGYGGTQRLPRLVGAGRAFEMIAVGRPVEAEEAKRIGLVNDVLPQAELLDHCLKLAARIAANGPLAVAAAIEAANRGLDLPIDAGLRIESALFGVIGGSEDMHEGLRAFLEKRKPTFRGE